MDSFESQIQRALGTEAIHRYKENRVTAAGVGNDNVELVQARLYHTRESHVGRNVIDGDVGNCNKVCGACIGLAGGDRGRGRPKPDSVQNDGFARDSGPRGKREYAWRPDYVVTGAAVARAARGEDYRDGILRNC